MRRDEVQRKRHRKGEGKEDKEDQEDQEDQEIRERKEEKMGDKKEQLAQNPGKTSRA
jgi:hypothetical protein